ncbi:hypothetical protein AWENTII_010316 [Aspergillus wentii]
MTEKSLSWPSWFDHPQGTDYPTSLNAKCSKWRACQITFGDIHTWAKAKVFLDSQQPRVSITLDKKENGQVVFTAERCDIEMRIEGDEASENYIRHQKGSIPQSL